MLWTHWNDLKHQTWQHKMQAWWEILQRPYKEPLLHQVCLFSLLAEQQRINMKYVTNNICKTRHCGHYLMETKTKDNWLSRHANMDQIIKILLIKEVHNKNQTAEEKLKWNDAVSLVNHCIHIRHCQHTL
jgi:hypothetical protein